VSAVQAANFCVDKYFLYEGMDHFKGDEIIDVCNAVGERIAWEGSLLTNFAILPISPIAEHDILEHPIS
jgi:hypothetical protein